MRRAQGWREATTQVAGRLPKPLRHKAPRQHRDTDEVFARRRKVVAGVSAVGTGLLGVSLSTRPGSPQFYALTFGVAGTWTAGSLISGPLHLGWIQSRDEMLRRPVVVPVLTGVGAFGFFYGCALVARSIPFLDGAISRVLRFADQGATPLVALTTCANGAAEEVFFRGALYAALGEHHPVAKSTVVYVLATVSTRNPALVLAAGVMGSLFALQRRASGGIQASMLTHLTWSILMLRYLPPLFRDEQLEQGWGSRRQCRTAATSQSSAPGWRDLPVPCRSPAAGSTSQCSSPPTTSAAESARTGSTASCSTAASRS